MIYIGKKGERSGAPGEVNDKDWEPTPEELGLGYTCVRGQTNKCDRCVVAVHYRRKKRQRSWSG